MNWKQGLIVMALGAFSAFLGVRAAALVNADLTLGWVLGMASGLLVIIGLAQTDWFRSL